MTVCLSFPEDYIRLFDEYGKAHGVPRNEAIMRLVKSESERHYPDEPDYPVADDPPMTCPGCQWWTAKNDNAGFCGLNNQVTTRLDGCINFVESEGEF